MKLTYTASAVVLVIGHITSVLAATPVLAARASISPSATPSTIPVPGNPTSHGCYSSGGNLTVIKGVEHMSSGSCKLACISKQYWVTGLHGDDCLCGFAYPPAKDFTTDNSNCNYPCPSYPLEACGGIGSPSYYSIFNNGINVDVPDYVPPVSSTSSAASSQTSSTSSTSSTSAAPTQAASNSASSTPTDSSKSGGTPTGAIVGGAVAGVVIVIAAIAGGFFYLRRKRNAEIEEEHRRNAAVNAFISGSKPPSSNGSISMTDSRLDPVMAHRRLSDGSIADNQDYSRKILRVTNA